VTRGRFAPSPTGDLHLGNVRTALLAWLQVRRAGGRFILRSEDLDRGRVRAQFRSNQIDDLRWLGIDWDEGPDVGGPYGPYEQSDRVADYEEALKHLANQGLVYMCACSRKEIAAAASAPHDADDEGPAYTGRCRARQADLRGRTTALRFRVPAGPVTFTDLLQGMRSYDPATEVGDFVVRRKDGVAAYQLAVVVDDHAMAITHVLRGADLLRSTSRQILLYRALGLESPHWTHVPLMLVEQAGRLSKRDRPLPMRCLRESGVPAERLVGWLAHTCGLALYGEEISARDLIERFDLRRLPRDDTYVAYPDWIVEAERNWSASS
jgi:glutamyl-tRNA synthetase